ncbi:MAG TPA: VTT domain-containing protein [Terriglobales bacterium]|nr:VTT domain-containing protein [Terriglobales bacterium]
MRTIEGILLRYTGLIWGMLGPLGSWAVFAIAGIDSAFFGIPLDPVVATYVYQKPQRFLLYVLMAAAGSASGSILLYIIGYKGGEALLMKRIPRAKFQQIRKSFDRHEFWTVMFPSMVPPPFPFKLFVLSAAAFEMNFVHFLLAIFVGRFVRFLILAFLVLKFGPVVVNTAALLVHKHMLAIVIVLAVAVAAWVLLWYQRRPGTAS